MRLLLFLLWVNITIQSHALPVRHLKNLIGSVYREMPVAGSMITLSPVALLPVSIVY